MGKASQNEKWAEDKKKDWTSYFEQKAEEAKRQTEDLKRKA